MAWILLGLFCLWKSLFNLRLRSTGRIVKDGGCVVGRWGVHSISHHSLSRFAGQTLLLGQLLQLVHLGEDVETCCEVGLLIEAMATLLYV